MRTTRKIRTYSELKRLGTLEERYRYLKLGGYVGENTFGFDRYINQAFYKSREWLDLRWQIIARDQGCDLGVEGYEIHARPTIHHLNPMTPRDIVDDDEKILNPEYLILTCQLTHNAIHYGNEELLPRPFTPRRPGDTKLW
jgi:hypothetical protein